MWPSVEAALLVAGDRAPRRTVDHAAVQRRVCVAHALHLRRRSRRCRSRGGASRPAAPARRAGRPRRRAPAGDGAAGSSATGRGRTPGPRSASPAASRSTNSSASPCTSAHVRRDRARRSVRARWRSPGVCTSTPITSSSGCACAIAIIVSPSPIPMSSTTGASRPNTAGRSSIGPSWSSAQCAASRSTIAARAGASDRRRGLNVRTGGCALGRASVTTACCGTCPSGAVRRAPVRTAVSAPAATQVGMHSMRASQFALWKNAIEYRSQLPVGVDRRHHDAVHRAAPPVVGPACERVADVHHVGARRPTARRATRRARRAPAARRAPRPGAAA